ncbi:hypothetical protein RB653_000120 [Dictyostelium firmibasis]|uniref:Glutamyl-tRNA(Gln) amidotransferase subunit A, mitochondrial n=1 Tax=Dictyostelium firmibasis TaxID=79012 RepID=A0AAN7U1T5_9MYCE
MNRLANISQIRKSLIEGKLKVNDLIQNKFKEINKGSVNHLNTFISFEDDKSLDRQIRESQERYDKGTNKRLDGIPIGVKDNFSSKSLKTTCGSKILENYIPSFDSTVVKLLKEEGAIIIGKTNMDEFSMGSSSTSGNFGSVINPWSKPSLNNSEKELYVAGGSSGGSAAAVASNYCVASIGSDTGGSIRQPSSYCGVVGFKPSYGLISRFGLISYASSLDTPGVLTNNVEDAAELLDVLIKKDQENDSTSLEFINNNKNNNNNNEKRNILKEFNEKLKFKNIKDLVFGIPKDYLIKELDEDILNLWKEVVEEIEKRGGKVIPVSLPHTRYALPAYYLLATSEASSNLSRFDGVRYGYRYESGENTNGSSGGDGSNETIKVGMGLKDMYTKTRTNGFGEEVKKRIILGTMALSRSSYDNFYTKAQKIRRLVSDDFKQVFEGEEKVDILITPTAPSPAFKQNEKMDPIEVYINDIMTIPSNLAGLPACSIPLKLSKSNLPISVQLISNRLTDDNLLFAAHTIMNFDNFKDFNSQIPNYLK